MHTHNVWRTIDEVRFLEGLGSFCSAIGASRLEMLKRYRVDRSWENEPFVDEWEVKEVLNRMIKKERRKT